MLDNGFEKFVMVSLLSTSESAGKILIVVLYVNDLIITASDDFLIANFKQVMKSEFEMTDLGLIRYFGHRSEANIKWKFYFSIKLCCRHFREV